MFVPQIATTSNDQVIAADTVNMLCTSWGSFARRMYIPEQIWRDALQGYLDAIAERRVQHIRDWLTANTVRFADNTVNLEELNRTFERLVVDLKSNVQLCGLQCRWCYLTCLQGRHHSGPHNCLTTHICAFPCCYTAEHP